MDSSYPSQKHPLRGSVVATEGAFKDTAKHFQLLGYVQVPPILHPSARGTVTEFVTRPKSHLLIEDTNLTCAVTSPQSCLTTGSETPNHI